MDWSLIFAAGSFTIFLIASICTFVYFVMRLITNPMKEDLDEMSKDVKTLTTRLKTDDDLTRMIDGAILKCRMNHCKES